VSLVGWEPFTEPSSLGGAHVHVYRVRLTVTPERADRLRLSLSPTERERADRFRFQRDRSAWTVSRAALRWVLAQYTGVLSRDLSFREGQYGKPFLDPGCDGAWLQFSLSHSDELALIALTAGHEVGVDVERIRPDVNVVALAHSVFSEREIARLITLLPDQQAEVFFNGWTRKEAFVKAVGEGLSFGLDRVEVSLAPGEPTALLMVDREGYQAADWSMMALEPGPGYRGALAVKGSGWVLRCFDLPENFE
jgi:4'-phosphopantetheinyl transferase